MDHHNSDLVIVGGGLGAVAAALAAARLGRSSIIAAPDGWLGGQLTSQAVPPDEHPWAETEFISSGYRELRERIREHYRQHYPLTSAARADEHLNPGGGSVSRLCHEPRVAAVVLEQMLAPYVESGQVRILRGYAPVAVARSDNRIDSVTVVSDSTGTCELRGEFVLDATELGELLPLADVPYVIGAESRAETGELHALTHAERADQQAITWCAAVEYRAGESHVIDRPEGYERWRDERDPRWSGSRFSWTDVHPITLADRFRPLFLDDPEKAVHSADRDLWHFRRILGREQLEPSYPGGEITLINWPQTDYWDLPLLGVPDRTRQEALRGARELTLSFIYWMQTEAPRYDGGHGYPELALRGDVLGTTDGLAREPYIRESRRIRALFTVTEAHIGCTMRGDGAGSALFDDSVGIGHYRIDLHPSAAGRNYVDITCFPFQIPLGALIPIETTNLLAANKSIGTTHITNGAYRLHPAEWSIGEAAGAAAAHCVTTGSTPARLRGDAEELRRFQDVLSGELGIPLAWPDEIRRTGVPDETVQRPERQWPTVERGMNA